MGMAIRLAFHASRGHFNQSLNLRQTNGETLERGRKQTTTKPVSLPKLSSQDLPVSPEASSVVVKQSSSNPKNPKMEGSSILDVVTITQQNIFNSYNTLYQYSMKAVNHPGHISGMTSLISISQTNCSEAAK